MSIDREFAEIVSLFPVPYVSVTRDDLELIGRVLTLHPTPDVMVQIINQCMDEPETFNALLVILRRGERRLALTRLATAMKTAASPVGSAATRRLPE